MSQALHTGFNQTLDQCFLWSGKGIFRCSVSIQFSFEPFMRSETYGHQYANCNMLTGSRVYANLFSPLAFYYLPVRPAILMKQGKRVATLAFKQCFSGLKLTTGMLYTSILNSLQLHAYSFATFTLFFPVLYIAIFFTKNIYSIYLNLCSNIVSVDHAGHIAKVLKLLRSV